MFNIKNLFAKKKSFGEKIKGLENKKFSNILRVLIIESEHIRDLIHKKDCINAIDYMDEYISSTADILSYIRSIDIDTWKKMLSFEEFDDFHNDLYSSALDHMVVRPLYTNYSSLGIFFICVQKANSASDLFERYQALVSLERYAGQSINILEQEDDIDYGNDFIIRDRYNHALYKKFMEKFYDMAEIKINLKLENKK